ncbi:phosphoglycerate mutase [Phlyctema vagabunda]|uniref:Phosphoglycerate mutase n=1 Tax=Phlyctema vagabunda TaxID=108571 RepID=A0ABR4PCR8_9HELO
MGWPPAVVIVVRHGARLDAADKQWHLTSPTPYDPPLTYGGWTQSKALGSRIAAILRSRETDDEIVGSDSTDDSENRRKRRHKVVIHSSPFLRCVQTSVAISAGLAQNPGYAHVHTPSSVRSTPRSSTPSQLHSSPKLRPTINTDSPRLAPIHEPSPSKTNGKTIEQHDSIKKSTVRVDAFLGEWLSPDYFELITPPPSSIMMVAGAKADLLRREDTSTLMSMSVSKNVNQGFPGGWQSPVTLSKPDEDSSLPTLSSLAHALPKRDRTSSLSSVGSGSSRHSGNKISSTINGAVLAEHGIYQPPIPNYSISSSDPIPPGYVAHARDSCVDVDYQWDSMRDPQNWGNGGEYGEEWSSMHKRFRKGLQQMIQWYSFSDEPAKLATKSPQFPSRYKEDVDDEDTDLVLVLVTHGAGCNALIGALTAQPVLLDVGMSSLTMAVRKPVGIDNISPTSTPRQHSRASSRNLSISEEYDVKLIANTEHLRSQSSTPSSSRAPSLAGMTAFRERYGVPGVPSENGVSFGKPVRSITTSAGLGSIRRNNSIATASPRNYVPVRQSSVGLWGSTPKSEEDEEEDLGSSMVLNFGNDAPGSPPEPTEEKISVPEAAVEAEKDEVDEVAPLGLWGSPRPPGDAERMREIAPKRRWTVNERASAPS